MPVVALDSPSPKRSILSLCLVVLMLAGVVPAFGQNNCSYIGTGGPTDWTTTSNWSCTPTAGAYPGQTAGDTATISSNVAFTVASAISNPVAITFFGFPTVQLNSGTLPVASDAISSGGTIQVNTGGTMTVPSTGALTFGSSANLTVAGGTLINNGTITIQPLGGTLNVSGGIVTNNVANGIVIQGLASAGTGGVFNWSGGTLDGTGSTLIQSALTNGLLNVTGPVTLNGPQTLNNFGSLNLSGPIGTTSGSPLIVNTGTITQNVAASTIAPPINNAGTMIIGLGGGAMTLTGGGSHSGIFNSPNTGTYIFGGGTHIFSAGSSFTGGSSVTVTGGTFQASTVLNISGSLTNSGGTIQFDPLTIQAIVPASFMQSAGTVSFKLNGTIAGTYDQIRTPGAASLGGTVAATLGYSPTPGDSYNIIQDASVTGDFTTKSLPAFALGAIEEVPSPPTGTAVTLAAVPLADIAVSNSGPATVNDGQNATFTITVTNNGPSPATSITVTNTITGGTFVSASGACTSFPCTIPSLAALGSATITEVVTATSTPTLMNSITANASSPADPTPGNNTASANVTVNPTADLALSSPITSTPAVGVSAGGTETFFVAFNNAGPDATTGTVTVTFSLTGGTITGASSPGWTCTTSQCTIPTLGSGAAGTITVTTTAQNQAGSMTLSANISSATNDPVPANNSASSAAVPVTASADLSITKAVSGSIVAGSNATYTITITNNGPSDATGVTLTDATPAGMTFVSATAPCSAGVTSCSIGTIPSAVGTNIVTITVVYSVPSSATGSVTNTASVNATTSDPVAGNNSATTPATTITTSADLAVSKSGPTNAPTGSNITYTISVINNGPSDAQGITLSDPTPSGLSFISATGACSSFPCSITTIPSGQTKTTQATYKILSGPVTNVASVTATTTDPNSSNNSASVTTSTACPSAPPANPSPAAGSTNVPTSGVLSWNGDGASSYTVYLDVAGPNACSKFFGSTSSTSIPYAGLQQGTMYQWRIVASSSGCPAVQATSCMTFTTGGSTCPQSAPALISPLNTTVNGPATFTWSSVAGATDYRLFVNGSLVATTTSTSFGPVPVGSGSVSWYVIADFASPCGSLQSPPGSFNGCDTTTAPIASVVGKAASGQTYDVSWDAIPGATQYQIDEATDVDFTAPTTQTVTATTVSFTHSVTTTTAYFYRVRAFVPCANGYSANSITVRVVLTPLSIVSGNPNVAAPAGSKTLIQVIVHVPGFADGSFPFTATLDQPWLVSVEPATGTLPPQGIDLTVSVDPTGLPNGTWTGTVILAIGAGKTGLIATNGTTTVSAPVSVSLVTPVTPLPAGTPSANTLIIPSLGHLDGINSQWQSDVRLANLSSVPAQYQVTFTPSSTSQSPRQTIINVDPGATTALDDVVNTWFGVGALGDSTNGVLQIQPMQTSGKSDSVSVALATAVSSRTYNLATNSNGTFGQFIPAIPFSSFVGASSDASHPATVLGLQQIAQSDAFRTNVGIVEGAGKPATVLISAFDDAGNKLLDFPLSINPNQQVQLNSFLAQNNIPLSDGRLQIKVLNGSGMITTYASVIDNRSGDPLLMSGVPIGQTASSSYVLPGVADLNTANAAWRTDMRIFNPTATAQFVTATFYPQNNGAPQMTSFTVNPGQIDRIDSTLATLFNGAAANMGGALHLTLGNPTSLVVTGRTYNFASNGGTYGQFIPAVTATDAVGNGDRALQILQTEDSVRYRTNVGIAEVTGNPATVQISVVLPGSKVSPSTQIPLQANEFIQIPVIQSLGLTNVYNARISVQVVGGTGKIAAYGSVIDQTTQAPTYVPAQ